MKKGLDLWGEHGVVVIEKKIKQFHNIGMINSIDSQAMTRKEKNLALSYLMLLKEKRIGNIKRRGVADGRKQQLWKRKEETAVSAVIIESKMLIYTINTKEDRDVEIVDIHRAFLQIKSKDNPTLRLDRYIVEALVEIGAAYEKFVTFEGKMKHPIIYRRAKQSIYGTLDAAMVYYKMFSKYVVNELGFEFNPYDVCVANKMIDKKVYNIL